MKCKDKIKKLKLEYKEVVDINTGRRSKRKTFRYFKKLDAVLGHKQEN